MPERTKEEKIYQLVIELEEAKKTKKNVVKAHSDEIKRIQSEIKDLLKENDEID
jgi:hypothetical protein